MEIPRGEITKSVYSLINEEKFAEAIEILDQLLDLQPTSRAALSLLGYCNFQLQNFDNAAIYYDRLSLSYPDIPEYQYYLAQSLYHSTNYEEALNASYLRGDPDEELQEKVTKLQAVIQYCRDEREDAKALVEKCKKVDADTEVSKGCLAYKEGNYSDASHFFENASNIVGMEPLLWYNRAVSYYQKGDLPTAAHYIGEIIEYGAITYPELKMGYKSQYQDSSSIISVGNSRVLHKSALIETLNLKSVVEYDLKKLKAARETLKDLPPRLDEELDPITLHNLAILNVPMDPLESLRKLRYLLEQNMFPPETFVNLLILYWRYEHYDLMADLMAVYDEYKMKYVNHDMRRFFESLIKREVAPNEATKEMEEQCIELGKVLLGMVQKVSSVKMYGNEDEIRNVCNEYDDLVDGTYMPMLLTLGKIYWDKDNLTKVEEVLKLGNEFLDDRDPWLINCAHVVYTRGKDYSHAAGLYELVVRKYHNELLQVGASSLGNLVVCYVTMGRNEEAEKMIQKIEEYEDFLIEHHGKGVKVYHSCIMSLVIGTLYCVKNNYQFGMSRIFQALGDFKTKLGPDTWLYVKTCILSLISRLVKINLSVSQETINETMALLMKCEEYGRTTTTVIEETSSNPQMEEDFDFIPINYGTKTVAYEARYLQYLLYKVKEQVFM